MTAFEKYQLVYFGITILILIFNLYFIYRSIFSPIDAVRVGRQLNNEQQKDNAKRNLFLTLFALRGNPTNYDFVKGLNEIDIVFEDNPSVLAAWHNHYRDLNDKGLVDPVKTWDIGRTRMLSAMATDLGYGSLNQTEIMEHYIPQGHVEKQKFDFDLQTAALNFFQLGHVVYQEMLNNTPSYTERMGKDQNNQPTNGSC